MSDKPATPFRIREITAKPPAPAASASAPGIASGTAATTTSASAATTASVTSSTPAAAASAATASATAAAAARATATAGTSTAGVPAQVAGLFLHAGAALAFLGAVAGAGLASEARARRGADGRWWVETPAPWQQAAPLVANAGGQPFAGGPWHWVAAPADGSPPPPPAALGPEPGHLLLQRPHERENLPLANWPEAGLADLVQATRLRPAKPRLHGHVVVLAPGVLARSILQRALGLGLEVQIASAEREALAGGVAASVSCLHLRWPQAPVQAQAQARGRTRAPEAFLHSLMQLPLVAVARPVGGADAASSGLLLVDIRHALPLAGPLLAELVPVGEYWLLGGPDSGHWRIRHISPASDAANLICLPGPPAMPDAPGSAPAHYASAHTTPVPLRLLVRAPLAGHPDAVLLDDTELAWLREYLIGKPAADTAYLLPGPACHLLLAPGGLLSTLPFGLPLRRIGPAGLHLQEGRTLTPPLPEAARTRTFPCAAGEIVAICSDGSEDGLVARRFMLDQLMPVWALWLAEPPPVASAANPATAQALRRLAATLEPSRLRQMAQKVLPLLRPRQSTDRDQLLRDAVHLQQQGRLAEAAQCLEQAGELAAAGRLYEQAAGA